MPEMIPIGFEASKIDGLEVLKRVRADLRTKQQPVVILTSSNEEQDLIKGYSLGTNSYIRKPVDSTQFAEVVRKLKLNWLVLNEQLSVNRGSR